MSPAIRLILAIATVAFATSLAHGEFTFNLSPEFGKWLEDTKEVSYRELGRRFVAAGGRDAKAYEEAMGKLTRDFLAFAATSDSPTDTKERAGLLRRFFFEERSFRANLDLENLDNLFPDAILRRRQGFCLGLSVLLADLGERIGWPLEVVSAPRHTFIRYRGSPSVNIETTLGGRVHEDDWYRKRYLLTGERASLLKPLTARETAAHLINNYGFSILEKGHLRPAQRELELSLGIHDDVVEARINLGVLEARQQDFRSALEHFELALSSWPDDPYLLLNCLNAHLALEDNLGASVRAIALARTGAAPSEFAAASTELKRRLRADLDKGKNWRLLQRLIVSENLVEAKKIGKKNGLVGSYYRGRAFEERRLSRIDEDISFRWSWDAPAREMPKDDFSIRWEGWLEVPAQDEYGLFVTCSDGVRIWVDGRLVVDSWRQANDSFPKGKIALDPGLHDFKIEYFEAIGEAGIQLILTAKKKERPLDLPAHLFHAGSKP